MVSILLYGTGSVGSIYLHQLQRANCKVTAVCRSNYTAVQQSGLTLHSPLFGTVTYRPDHLIRSLTDCPQGVVYDYILITTKALSPETRPTLADQLRPLLTSPHTTPETAIVLAQNGIDIEQALADAYPTHPILSAVIYLPATQSTPGVIHHAEPLNRIEVGTYPASAPAHHKAAASHFRDLMAAGGGDAILKEDIQTARWSKLLLNASWNPICALSLCTDGGFLLTSTPFARDLVWGIMMEIVALAAKVGVHGVDEDAAREKLAIAERRAETGTGREMSMLQDVRAGRPFEVEVILGNTVRLGRRWGVAMPRLETVYALAKGRYDVLVGDT
ncbi:2-dehydropantoate 2-reductase [Aspergillus campestris IBT 28561]|uniref:2-dehydropantoate 2-reductase n=1 Tax=Aspergillus campestris (strain IBT 28561) TaxID=1392248 RepID=A0A2I1D9U2_ASPC2|nr:2-dehydropantoate 2-reductase [Aspergillus campestris IBT 28561]PKY06645.1 2-dehydropantoate 2-reductase [Aspergillus campestris IBT 28561]